MSRPLVGSSRQAKNQCSRRYATTYFKWCRPLVSPFTRQDLAKVHACLHAIAPIEARGMTLITRIELAAVLLASACSHGYTSGDETGEGSSGPAVFALAEQLVMRRAREIYAQDSA